MATDLRGFDDASRRSFDRGMFLSSQHEGLSGSCNTSFVFRDHRDSVPQKLLVV
jgi:hypothetical protein